MTLSTTRNPSSPCHKRRPEFQWCATHFAVSTFELEKPLFRYEAIFTIWLFSAVAKPTIARDIVATQTLDVSGVFDRA
jgi:hypothetical protein